MKKLLLFLLVLSSAMLCAQAKKVPILWKTKDAAPAKFQITAFGFLDEKDDVIFAYEIKNFAELIKLDSHLSQYYNADNDVKTGRFPNNLGIDLQINGRFKSGTAYGPMKWNSQGKATQLPAMKGEKLFLVNGDVVFYVISKQVLGDIKFKPQFRVGASFYVKGMKKNPKAIHGSVWVDTTKVLGNFEMPAIK